MGYKVKRTIYRLVFEGKYEGLIVSAKAPLLGFLESAMKMSPLVGKNTTQLTAEDLELVTGVFSGFAKYLVEWNVEEDDGTPIPATLEGLQGQDIGFVMEIVEAWLNAAGEVAPPLEQPSNSGSPSLVGSLPMEPLSPSLPSSPGPSSSSAIANDSGASLVS